MTRLLEFILPSIIGVMVHKRETLTQKEQKAQNSFLDKLQIKKRKTKKAFVVATVGLVGSGKSSVAKELAKAIGATIIEGDAIRIELRKQKERYEGARKIAENVALEIIKQGGNVIFDSDHIDQKKRASIREKMKGSGANLVFVRTHCDLDVVVGRVLTASYRNEQDDFFGGASSKWQGSAQSKGVAVKVREMWRRTPHHYRWENKVGGKWILKKLPFAVFAEINTTENWKKEVEKLSRKFNTL